MLQVALEVLNSQQGLAPFDKFPLFLDYFTYLQDFKRAEKTAIMKTDWFHTANLDGRLEKNNFYAFPDEEAMQRNCFELSSYFYLFLAEKYPESKPELLQVALNEYDLHGSVVFTHNDRLIYGDPTWNVIGPASIGPSSIQIDNQVVGGQNWKLEFNDLCVIPPPIFREMVDNLRSPGGLLDLCLSSGQIVSEIPEWPYYKKLFMYVDTEDVIHGQIRVTDVGVITNPYRASFPDAPVRKNLVLKMSFNPSTRKYSASMNAFETEHWHGVSNECSASEGWEDHVKIMLPFTSYLQETQFKFDAPTQSFKPSASNLKDLVEASSLGPEFLNYYTRFAKVQDGETFGLEHDGVMSIEKSFYGLLGTPMTATEEEHALNDKMFRKTIDDRFRFQIFRLAYDFKRYSQRIDQYM
jgi:hypothetical protein